MYSQLVDELDSLISDYNRVQRGKQPSALGKAASSYSSKADATLTVLEYGGGDTAAYRTRLVPYNKASSQKNSKARTSSVSGLGPDRTVSSGGSGLEPIPREGTML